MPYTTYENPQTRYVIIHRDCCREIDELKQIADTKYEQHQNYPAALRYAHNKIMRPVMSCSRCNP